MSPRQPTIIELLTRKIALQDVELWLNQQYLMIDTQIAELEKDNA